VQGKWSCGLLILSPAPSCGMGGSEWGCRRYGGSEYGNHHWDSFHLGGEGMVKGPSRVDVNTKLEFLTLYWEGRS
jgi:hypothetical protein